jgi:hypothetical protein
MTLCPQICMGFSSRLHTNLAYLAATGLRQLIVREPALAPFEEFDMTKCVKMLQSKSKVKSMDQSQAQIKPFRRICMVFLCVRHGSS